MIYIFSGMGMERRGEEGSRKRGMCIRSRNGGETIVQYGNLGCIECMGRERVFITTNATLGCYTNDRYKLYFVKSFA